MTKKQNKTGDCGLTVGQLVRYNLSAQNPFYRKELAAAIGLVLEIDPARYEAFSSPLSSTNQKPGVFVLWSNEKLEWFPATYLDAVDDPRLTIV